MVYIIKCDICGRELGRSSRPQAGFTCGYELQTHLDGSEIVPPPRLTELEADILRREIENLYREVQILKEYQR